MTLEWVLLKARKTRCYSDLIAKREQAGIVPREAVRNSAPIYKTAG